MKGIKTVAIVAAIAVAFGLLLPITAAQRKGAVKTDLLAPDGSHAGWVVLNSQPVSNGAARLLGTVHLEVEGPAPCLFPEVWLKINGALSQGPVAQLNLEKGPNAHFDEPFPPDGAGVQVLIFTQGNGGQAGQALYSTTVVELGGHTGQ